MSETTAIVGVGNIGGAVARHLVAGGESVVLAAKDQSSAEALAATLGPLALGPGSHSLDNAFDIGSWAGIHWSMSTAGRAGIAVAIGAVCGLLPVIGAAMTKPVDTDRHAPAHAGG
jgi:predicted dinucleotide-binding enzyme